MRILIAEDELIERKAMKKFIEENFNDIYVVGEAANGRKAIELTETTRPDVIFMDIKMPGINGLEAVEAINAKHPSIKFILVSAYDSFDYAKQAMRFGIKDYILKPGKKEEIVKALLRVKKEMEAEADQQKEKRQAEQLKKERFVSQIIQGHVREETFQLRDQLFPSVHSGYFLVMKTDVAGDFSQVGGALEKYLVQHFVEVKTEDTLSVCIFAQDCVKKADMLITVRKLHIGLGNDMYIGIGSSYSNLEKLPQSYQEAYSACLQLQTENKRNYGFFQTNEKQGQVDETINKICLEMEKGNSEKAIYYFKDNQSFFKEADKEDLYINIKNRMASRDISMAEASITSIKTDSDWYTFLHMCCMKISDYYQSRQFMLQAKKYIGEHYQEAITLEDTAASVNLSPNYFSNMFKEAFEETFIDYVTKLRMEKAKELVMGNAYSLKEISYMVGYNDPNYFSRVFKKYYQASPKRFQESIFKK